MTRIDDQTVLITGAASGIGRLMALKMAARGARIVAWDIDADRLDGVLEELRNAGARDPRACRCDVSDRAAVNATARRVVAETGAVDILVNNAGVVSGSRFLDLTEEQVRRTFAVNTLSLYWVTQAFLPAMVERNQGHVVTIASASGLIGVNRLSDYAASKWAAIGFDESLRFELREMAPGVRTTVVCPFYIDTGMFTGVKTRWRRLLPILKEEVAARRIVAAVERGRRRLSMPWIVNLVPPMRALPVGLFDAIADQLGVNRSMDEFVGRRSP